MHCRKFLRRLVPTLFAVLLAASSLFGGAFAGKVQAAPAASAGVSGWSSASRSYVGTGTATVSFLIRFSNRGQAWAYGSTAPSAQPQLPELWSPWNSRNYASGGARLWPQPNPYQAPAATPAPPASASGNLTADEAQALALLNADRAANGLPPLRANSRLNALAENYAQDMINRGYFSHTNPEGQSPFDRMRQAGVTYRYAGENLAINTSVSGAEQAFMNSPGHRANILNPHYTEVGVGVRYGSNGSVYVVQEFIGQ